MFFDEKNFLKFLVSTPTCLSMGYGPHNVVATVKIPFTASTKWSSEMRRSKYVELIFKLRKWLRFLDDGNLLERLTMSSRRFYTTFHVYIPHMPAMMPRLDLHVQRAYCNFFSKLYFFYIKYSSSSISTTIYIFFINGLNRSCNSSCKLG